MLTFKKKKCIALTGCLFRPIITGLKSREVQQVSRSQTNME